ncbi:SAM-dependent methyltransferase [Xenophilus sp. AP218F]|nr:SAM-dependent methyltransferase [Xenophilus sp. AP218F]
MQDSSKVDFWDQRYREGVTPWEGARWPSPAQRFFERLPTSRLLLPGCGSAADLAPLRALGHQVLAVDFSGEAIAAARRQWPAFEDCLMQADFFALRLPPVDVVLERAFLCALPPAMRGDYARQVAALVRPGGFLAGFFFLADKPKGPPFGIARGELEALLQADFELQDCRHVADSLPIFQRQEYWMQWRRREGAS